MSEINLYRRYNQIHKWLALAAFMRQSAYRFSLACSFMSKGIMRASQVPVDTELTKREWFRIGVKLLIKPLIDENTAESPDDLHVSDGHVKTVMNGFNKLVKSLRWYLEKLKTSPEREYEADGWPVFPLEIDFQSACDILKWVILQIDGGDLCEDPGAESEHIRGQKPEDLLFHTNEKIGVRTFEPWTLERLFEDCERSGKLPSPYTEEMNGSKMAELRKWFADYLDNDFIGITELTEYLDENAHLVKDLPGEIPLSPPPPPNRTEKAEKPEAKPEDEKPKAKKARLTAEEKDGFTVYTDSLLGKTYKISNGAGAKKTIDKFLLKPLVEGVEQWNENWKKYKGQFQRDDAASFNNDQIEHEHQPNERTGTTTKQYTGRWRIRTDAEILALRKRRKKAE